ncbi:hypothetical protein [Pseudomonas paeninsulae]|uniref:hypothetical protein n=1 Tax=Pseudomonas paeninsulae TaxID=3110772 RepID=UPI002D7A3D91|nr:hypothetical protein [Pseudomonas sp. IT1137]
MPLLKTIRQATPYLRPLQALARHVESVLPDRVLSAALAVNLSNTAGFRHNGLLASKSSHVITAGCR